MTQNTLSDEIERVVKEFRGKFVTKHYEEEYEGKEPASPWNGDKTGYFDEDFVKPASVIKFFEQAVKSIAEKTVEAVRVEKKEELDVFIEDGDLEGIEIDGFNQAVTEQSKLASHWLGEEEV